MKEFKLKYTVEQLLLMIKDGAIDMDDAVLILVESDPTIKYHTALEMFNLS
tara:strand:- start:765 stop:917 length:153 start_codon:yes stop_codon:yes gene_type:complete